MTDCEKILDMLDDYIDGDLTFEEKEEADNHLSSCQSCREELEFKKSIIKATQNIDILKLPEDFSDKVMEKIKDEKKRTFFSPRVINSVAACFIVAVVLGVSGNLLKKDNPQNDDFYPVPVQDEIWTVLTPANSDEEGESAYSPRMITPDDSAKSEAVKNQNVFYVDEENLAFARELGKICGEFDENVYKMPKDAFILFIQQLADMGAKVEFDFSLEDEIIFSIEKI